MSHLISVFKREFRGYFATPVAYVFIVIFLFLTGLFTFNVSRFFDPRDPTGGQADLRPFFSWHPWLYLFLIPAVAMRLWSEERKGGTVELLLTLPITGTQAIVGKFLAAWAFIGIALALTFPMVLTLLYLCDNPDMGPIFTGYMGSFLMAGAYLAIGECISALAKNQVVSFIISSVVCLLLVLAGYSVVQEFFRSWASAWFCDAISSVSFLTHFDTMVKGLVPVSGLVFFASLIVGWLAACGVVLEVKKAV